MISIRVWGFFLIFSFILILSGVFSLHSCKKLELTRETAVTTDTIIIVSNTSANAEGTVIDLGETNITDHGHCWSTSPEPTIDDNKTSLGAASQTGSFSSTLTGLSVDDTYHIRAYITDGSNVKYGITKTLLIPNPWQEKADFIGAPRSGAVGFSIGSKLYIGTGSGSAGSLDDFWEYDPDNMTWTQKAAFGGGQRTGAVGFSIGNKGYIGTGSYTDDFYQYDPGTNKWTQKAAFGGGLRAGAVGFSIGNKGYIGTGEDVSLYFNDFYEYDPGANKWTRMTDFGGTPRQDAVGFSIGSKGYIGTGFYYDGFSGIFFNDFWEYDPGSNKWTRMADFMGKPRLSVVGFSTGSKGYIGTGGDFSSIFNDFYEYDIGTNTCTRMADFIGTPRGAAVGLFNGNKGYIVCGATFTVVVNDFWEFTSY